VSTRALVTLWPLHPRAQVSVDPGGGNRPGVGGAVTSASYETGGGRLARIWRQLEWSFFFCGKTGVEPELERQRAGGDIAWCRRKACAGGGALREVAASHVRGTEEGRRDDSEER
jgi:hypothetical protein